MSPKPAVIRLKGRDRRDLRRTPDALILILALLSRGIDLDHLRRHLLVLNKQDGRVQAQEQILENHRA